MMLCPVCSTENVDGSKFCLECGASLDKFRIISAKNIFSEEDSAAIDKLIYNVSQSERSETVSKSDNQTIIALGDITNVPEDYKGSIRTTGKVTFTEGSIHRVEIRYESSTTSCRKEAIFRKAFVIRRMADSILIQTDFARYCMNDSMLSPLQRRVFSRTPIVVVRENDRYYLMCEKDGDYIQGEEGPLNSNCIYQVVPLQEYRIGNFASFRFS